MKKLLVGPSPGEVPAAAGSLCSLKPQPRVISTPPPNAHGLLQVFSSLSKLNKQLTECKSSALRATRKPTSLSSSWYLSRSLPVSIEPLRGEAC